MVGPEAPLVAGRRRRARRRRDRAASGRPPPAARLEGSKAFCKEVMGAAGVPDRGPHGGHRPEAGMAAITGYPAVIKADGLAAGKGVIIAADEAEARAALEELLVERRFGTERVVVEEFLDGEELSLLALCDGRDRAAAGLGPGLQADLRRRPRPQHRRHGLLLAGARRVDEAARAEICAAVHQPVLDELARRGIAVSRRPLRGADDDRRRAQGARVQRPLRRSRDAGDPAAAAHGPARAAARPRVEPGGLRGAPARVGAASGGDRGAGERRLPGVVVQRRRDQRPGRGAGGRVRDPRRHRPRRAAARSSPPAAGC